MTSYSLLTGPWTAPDIPADIPHGDMPGDKVCIEAEHIRKAQALFPAFKDLLAAQVKASPCGRAVACVCGGSGVGKSEIASLLGFYLKQLGVGAYVLSGDNYPRRIPRDNDLERLRVYRNGGLRALADEGLLTPERMEALRALWREEADAEPARCEALPWLSAYQKAARRSLTEYLGARAEIDFDQLSAIVAAFKRGAAELPLKRMGREIDELWIETVDMRAVSVLIIEWTHGNSDLLEGVDIPILLNSTPAETLAHRRARNRDGKTDSAFTTTVLEIEQQKLEAQAWKAKLILSKQGELLAYRDYRRLMADA